MPLATATGRRAPARPIAPDLTPEDIEARIQGAVLVLALLPREHVGPRGYGRSLAPLTPSKTRVRQQHAEAVTMTPIAIDRAHETMGWLSLLGPDAGRERRILLLRAGGRTWAEIGADVGLTGEGARKASSKALERLSDALTIRALARHPS